MENIIYYIDKNGNYYTDQNNNYFTYKVQQSNGSNRRITSYIFINGQFKKVKSMIAKNSTNNLIDAILTDENGNTLTDENNQILYAQISTVLVGDCTFYSYMPKIF